MVDWLRNVFITKLSKEELRRKAKEEAKRLRKIFIDLREASEELLEQIFEHPDKFYVYLRIIAPLVDDELVIGEHVFKPMIVRVLELPEVYGMVVIEDATFYFIAVMSEWNISRNIKIVFIGKVPLPILSRARHLF
jgi:hypothetical protein